MVQPMSAPKAPRAGMKEPTVTVPSEPAASRGKAQPPPRIHTGARWVDSGAGTGGARPPGPARGRC